MKAKELTAIQAQLQAEKAELQALESNAKASADTVELDQSRMGRLTRMDALQGQQMALEAARRRQQQLVAIDGALQRLAAGEFGDCFVCGEQISQQRLSFDPTSTRCMDCVDKA
ncbi:MAG: TraR/DksA family transcriptional regulator [Gammaproteobacteria bacterium]